MKIALDAMGGDYAPGEIVKGAVAAAKKFPCEIVLVGDEAKIQKILDEFPESKDLPLEIRHAGEVIEMGEHPADAVRTKKDASVVVATRMVKDGECDAVLSAGSTGAAVAAAQFILKRIHGVARPAIATPFPTLGGVTLMLDSGAIVDSKPEHLVQSALMGSLYAERVFGKKNPRVGLLNIGEEETKGNELVKETYRLLQNLSTVNFGGNAEGRDIPKGNFDVVVCDGFVGNVVLKFGEGLAITMLNLIRDAVDAGGLNAKIGALLLKPTLKKLAGRLDVSEYGSAPLLGVNGNCFIGHGTSDAKSICSAIGTAINCIESNFIECIKNAIEKENMLPTEKKEGDIQK